MTLRRSERAASYAAVAILWSSLTACGSAGFGGASGGSPRDKEAELAPHAPSSDASGQPASGGSALEPDDEDETADKPQPVSGAFLTCAPLSTPGADPAASEFGCRVEKSGQMVDLAQEKVAWSLIDKATSAEGGGVLTVLAKGSPWHVAVQLPTAQVVGKQVRVAIDWRADGTTTPEILKSDLGSAAGTDGELTLRFGAGGGFHVGNGAYPDSACQSAIQATPLSGSKIEVPFTVGTEGAGIKIVLAGLCGVDYDQVNSLVLRTSSKVLVTLPLTHGAKSLATDSLMLPAGDYWIDIESHLTKSGDRDDFVIGDVFVTGSGTVQGGAPVVAATKS